MTLQTMSRFLAIAAFSILVSGCAWHQHPWGGPSGGQHAVTSECRTRAQCDFNGQYEPGEDVYAEQEAKRLNRAQLERMQRANW